MFLARLFLVKVLVTFVLLGVTLPILVSPVSVWPVIWATVGVGIPSFLIGDLLILPRFGQMTAFFADVLLAALILWLLPAIAPSPVLSFGAAFTAAVVLSMGEFFLHRALKSRQRVEGPE